MIGAKMRRAASGLVVPAGGPLTESFNKADSTVLGPDLAWTEHEGSWDVVSNQAKCISLTGTGAVATPNTDLAVDHYAQAECTATGGMQVGVACRYSSVGNYYFAYWRGGSQNYRIARWVSGGFTQLGQVGAPASITNTVLRLQVVGSSLSLYVNGTLTIGPVTDTTYSTQLRAGIWSGNTVGGIIDNFEAGDM